jgi:hypothetical protein
MIELGYICNRELTESGIMIWAFYQSGVSSRMGAPFNGVQTIDTVFHTVVRYGDNLREV